MRNNTKHRRAMRALLGFVSLTLLGVVALPVIAQWQRRSRWQRRPPARSEYPQWHNPESFESDVFTFVRIQFDSPARIVDGRWDNDYPDSDWNFSYRLQQLTSIRTDPHGRVLRLDDPELLNYPFAYMLGIRDLELTEAEVLGLRRYLRQGGFLMVDDFWSAQERRQVFRQMRRVFPELRPVELNLDHEIFQIVYSFTEIPQVPSIQAWSRGSVYEFWHGDAEGDESAHFYGYLDEHGRLMALLCYNNDIGDGWEREGENKEYFRLFSEKYSYPLGINIVMYALTQ